MSQGTCARAGTAGETVAVKAASINNLCKRLPLKLFNLFVRFIPFTYPLKFIDDIRHIVNNALDIVKGVLQKGRRFSTRL